MQLLDCFSQLLCKEVPSEFEQFARHGVETLFVKAPQSASVEDQLLVQFQGIAEDARAQILERSRRASSIEPAVAKSVC